MLLETVAVSTVWEDTIEDKLEAELVDDDAELLRVLPVEAEELVVSVEFEYDLDVLVNELVPEVLVEAD